MGKNATNTAPAQTTAVPETTVSDTTSVPETTPGVNGATAPATNTPENSATASAPTTSAPARKGGKPAGYVPQKDDAVYKDGTVVVGGKKKVKITIPEEPGVKMQVDVYAKANDNSALIQRGRTVSVPRPLAEVIKESQKREKQANAYYYANSN